MFNSIINGNLNVYSGLICFGVSIILGLIISIINMYTNRHSKNFSITLAVLPFLVSIVIIMVNGNLGAGVAVAGAFSLIRFRSVPGNSRDILLIFFAMSIGIAIGMGYVWYSVIATILGSLFIYVLAKSDFGNKEREKLLKITIPEEMNYNDVFNNIFNEYLKSYEAIKVKTIDLGSLFQLTYKIKMKEQSKEKELIDEIRVINGNLKIVLESMQDENEL